MHPNTPLRSDIPDQTPTYEDLLKCQEEARKRLSKSKKRSNVIHNNRSPRGGLDHRDSSSR